MARYVASIIFADGDQLQTSASGAASYPDALHQLRVEAVQGLREIASLVRIVDEDDDAEVAEVLDRLERGDEQ